MNFVGLVDIATFYFNHGLAEGLKITGAGLVNKHVSIG
jgi:hypothetical protein